MKSYLLTATVAAMAAISGQARADLKVISDVSVTGAPSAAASTAGRDGKSTVTTYYKGAKVRVEHSNGAKVTLFDGAHSYVLDPNAKTYYMIEPKASGGSFTLKPEVSASKTSDTKTIAGKQTVRYALTGNIQIEPGAGGARAGGGRLSGLRGKRGGVGGGGGMGQMSLKFSGDLWAASDLGIQTASILPALAGSGLPAMDSIANQLKDSLANAGLVLSGSFKIDPPSMAQGRMGTITVTIDAKSVEQTTLDDAMFKVPDSYQKVAQPTRQGRGGFGGGGSGG